MCFWIRLNYSLNKTVVPYTLVAWTRINLLGTPAIFLSLVIEMVNRRNSAITFLNYLAQIFRWIKEWFVPSVAEHWNVFKLCFLEGVLKQIELHSRQNCKGWLLEQNTLLIAIFISHAAAHKHVFLYKKKSEDLRLFVFE